MAIETRPIPAEAPAKPIAAWAFWLPMALQLLIVASVPAPKVYAHHTGTTVLLRSAPVDPYDVLRGRYMALGYADDDIEVLRKLPGYVEEKAEHDKPLWVELAPTAPAKPWKPVRVHHARPEAVPPGHVAIRGKVDGMGVDWGLGAFYMPEDQGDAIEAAMRKARPENVAVEVRVDAGGGSVLEALVIDGRRY